MQAVPKGGNICPLFSETGWSSLHQQTQIPGVLLGAHYPDMDLGLSRVFPFLSTTADCFYTTVTGRQLWPVLQNHTLGIQLVF